MEVSQVLHMNGGEEEISYFNNSLFQKRVILTVKPVLQESIAELCNESMPECMTIAELGCASGPNTLLPLWEIIQTIDTISNRLKTSPPILQVFLNDLPRNDFNSIFKFIVPSFKQILKKEKGGKFEPCFIAATAGSFYGRLFPPRSLHFVHSSYSLHWCSQVPKGLVSKSGVPLNRGNICVAETSPASVEEAYECQFESDFRAFLKSRADEMVAGGHMVVTLIGKSNRNVYCKYGSEIWQLIGTSLYHMAQEGVIEESALDSFNIPLYCPSIEEVRDVIECENSFTIKRVEEFELSWDANIEDGNSKLVFDKWERGKYVANYMRAAAEPLLATQFGDGAVIDNLFDRLSYKVAEYLEKGIGIFNNLVISMTRK